MHLKELSIINFKNFEQLELDFSSKINCFVGKNGVGKTNILDAIYYLSMCKSYLNPIDTQNIKYDNNFFVIQGDYLRLEKDENIYCGLKKNHKKQFKRNKKEYQKLTEHIGLLPIVMISPLDNILITGGSEERRKFINGVISQYDNKYLNNLVNYNRALTQRNKLLKIFSKNNSFDKESIEIWDEQLINLGQSIFYTRKDFIEKLIPIFQKYYNHISKDAENVSMEYKSQLSDNNFRDLLNNSIEKDKIVQHTSIGIHKDDITLNLLNHPVKKAGSQGQQKTLLDALKLAKFDFIKNIVNYKPILLLDDIFDKFDINRVKQIINLVSQNNFGQIFISDTSQDRLKIMLNEISINYKIFTISENGNIN
ncbi:MAG: DNA replication and repair protein RecF [Bacteroidales bacterium]|jgi:DNA replication and repair protein RecF|nr:DNA replication and repair protein RecF [Bacteroidales bacterium]